MSYLECNNLKLHYKNFNLSVDLKAEKGELIAIIGPSGSGKSTLLSLLCGLENPDEGSIILDGKDITQLPVQNRQIGMVFQDFSLFSSMNVKDNIQYGMHGLDKEQKDSYTKELLKLVDLEGYEKRAVHQLSGGEAQRIALARALAAKPQILLFDEPLSALDAPLRKKLRTVIRDIHDRTQMTMLYVTHDREEAFAIADRIIIMKDGSIQSEGTAEQLYKKPINLFCANFTGEGSVIKVKDSTYFVRPEDIQIVETTKQEDNCLLLQNAKVIGNEYTGNNYIIRLVYNDSIITALSRTPSTKDYVNLEIQISSLISLSISM
ncbi:MAG: ABC transporter ATP-binding protein [Sphaerochaetaceae bacterium]|nr:ABC transporter ATP-binding protein [Sphaerochaetaceae bacterium]